MHELLALEAIARLGSVQAAADALHVTPSGVSHRVGSLERKIGAKLLRRQGRGVVLTEVAQRCVDAVRPSLAELSAATARLRSREHELVRIATAPAVAVAWLLPRLAHYAGEHGAVRFEILSVATTDELPTDRWDVLIHYGEHPKRGSRRRQLFDDRLVRVCAPSLLAAAAGDAARIASLPVLRLAQIRAPSGEPASRRAAPEAPAQLVFDDALAMLEAAAAGAGVALCTETSAAPYLASGRLARVAAEPSAGDQYAADLSEAGQLKPAAVAFFDWLVRQPAPAP